MIPVSSFSSSVLVPCRNHRVESVEINHIRCVSYRSYASGRFLKRFLKRGPALARFLLDILVCLCHLTNLCRSRHSGIQLLASKGLVCPYKLSRIIVKALVFGIQSDGRSIAGFDKIG